MKILKLALVILISLLLSNISLAKDPSELINDIVNEASLVLKSSDPVESKIIKLNAIAEKNVDIDGIGMYTLGKFRKQITEDEKIKYKKLFRSYFLKSFLTILPPSVEVFP